MASMSETATLPKGVAAEPNQWLVIGASSLGTVFEWYDFYLYGLLASVISAQFFSGVNEVTSRAYRVNLSRKSNSLWLASPYPATHPIS